MFEGARFAGVPVSSFIITHPPGGGPKLHVHPYPEVFIVLSGQVTFQVGDQVVEAGGGQIVIAPAETPHQFRNTGSTSMSMVSIQPNGHVIQENLEE